MGRVGVARHKITRISVNSDFSMDQSLAVVRDHQLVLRNPDFVGVVFYNLVALCLGIEYTAGGLDIS